jgi:hypothetical protein
VNPEFRRNLWLELTPHRLVAMPLLLVLVLALVYAASDDKMTSVAVAAGIIAAGLLGVWGTRSSADCVIEEVRARTWDAQRMSAIGPWAMTWGKLLGAASFAWYGGLMALAAVLAASPAGWAHPAAKVVALIAAAALLLQCVACLAGISAARKGYARQGSVGAWLIVLLLVALGPGIGFVSSEHAPVAWWGERYGAMNLMLASTACFAAWAAFGVYRTLCGELQVRTTPWAFAAFALFLTAYVAGFWVVPGAGLPQARNAVLIAGLLVAGILTYVQLFAEQTGVIVFRHVQVRLARREWRRALEEMPCWPVGFALASVFCILGVLLLPPVLLDARELVLAPLPLTLLLARDICIFLFFAFGRLPRRVEAATLFYLGILYLLAPWLLSAAGSKALADLVLPPVFLAPGKAAVVAAVQAALAAALVVWRWRRYPRPVAPAAQG